MGEQVEELVSALANGQRRAVARLLTIVEDGDPDVLRTVVRALHPRGGGARVVGITGSPGVGKSTLTNAIATALRERDETVGVLAVDPSSPFSGGALLGDRVRMQGHHADPGVFIRSMATRGHLGGLSFATPQAVLVLDAAGFDTVVIETVGVGQSEVEVAATADTTVVALAPGMGDGIQAAKAGILEVGDVFVINKADAGGAGRLEAELRGMLELGHAVAAPPPDDETRAHHGHGTGPATNGPRAQQASADRSPASQEPSDAWWPPIQRTVAVRDEGIAELVEHLDAHLAHGRATGALERRRTQRARHLVREVALEQVRHRFTSLDGRPRPGGAEPDTLVDDLAARVAARNVDPYTAADELLAAIDGRA